VVQKAQETRVSQLAALILWLRGREEEIAAHPEAAEAFSEGALVVALEHICDFLKGGNVENRRCQFCGVEILCGDEEAKAHAFTCSEHPVHKLAVALSDIQTVFDAWWSGNPQRQHLTAASFASTLKEILDRHKAEIAAVRSAGPDVLAQETTQSCPDESISTRCALDRRPVWQDYGCKDYVLAEGLTGETPRNGECDGCHYCRPASVGPTVGAIPTSRDVPEKG
jgi:hypothetical protein